MNSRASSWSELGRELQASWMLGMGQTVSRQAGRRQRPSVEGTMSLVIADECRLIEKPQSLCNINLDQPPRDMHRPPALRLTCGCRALTLSQRLTASMPGHMMDEIRG